MSNASGIVCVIPARGGSKGIPGKNLIDFGGKPLVAWSIDVALRSSVIDRVVVSTDSEEIAEAARVAGAEVPFIRPPELANDAVHSVHVVFHTLDWFEKEEGLRPEGVMMLLPTSPLRRPEDVYNAVSLFRTNNAPSVVSVCDLGKYLTNLRFMRQGRLVMAAPGENANAQRQGAEKLYGVNGSIFLARPDALRRAGTFHMDETFGYVMDDLDSVDINSAEDLSFARRLLKVRAVVDSNEGGRK